jgi:hypothetical protein
LNLKFLVALNVAHSDDELLDHIDFLAGQLENGNIAAAVDGDLILSLYLTETGIAALPPTLDAATA